MRRLLKISATAIMGLGLALTGCKITINGTNPNEQPSDVQSSEKPVDSPKRDAGATLSLVTTQAEPVKGNDAWCGTMQLCWNSLIDEVLKGNPVVFEDAAYNTEEVEHLNARLFGTKDVSEDHYYTYAGPMTSQAKEEIEQAISDKFGQRSDILDKFDGWDQQNGEFLYAMLYRKFSFATPFALSYMSGQFGSIDNGNKAENVAYFETGSDEQRKQVTPLYYDDYDRHAVRIATADGDELILVKSPQGTTLDEIWKNTMEQTSNATKPLDKEETFKCPVLDIDLLQETYPWIMRKFNGDWYVTQAMQTLKLHLDNEGGEVKSEAGIEVAFSSTPQDEMSSPRRFVYDDTFAMFVRDGNAGDDAYPYVGVLVSDITQFQDGAQKA